ncbi:hypothetical protein, partial [Salinicoccus roseus]|uniref:hypothetical protein n=1 Tax=Salinicoccus roseus TaxID=45670 RepID=UPI003DA04F82
GGNERCDLGGIKHCDAVVTLERCQHLPEEMTLELNQITIVDGNGNELEQRLILTGKLSSGDYINVSPYILFKCKMEVIEEYSEEEPDIRRHVISVNDSYKM